MLATVGCAVFLLRPWMGWRSGRAMDGAILALALYLGVLGDMPGILMASQRWGVAACAGVVLFACAVWVTTPDWRGYFRQRVRLGPSRLWSCLRVTLLAPIHEEWVWRVAFQSLLALNTGRWIAVVLTGVVFAAWHRRAITRLRVGLELLTFSWVFGACYALYHDVVAVLVIHGLRNLFAFSVWEPES